MTNQQQREALFAKVNTAFDDFIAGEFDVDTFKELLLAYVNEHAVLNGSNDWERGAFVDHVEENFAAFEEDPVANFYRLRSKTSSGSLLHAFDPNDVEVAGWRYRPTAMSALSTAGARGTELLIIND